MLFLISANIVWCVSFTDDARRRQCWHSEPVSNQDSLKLDRLNLTERVWMNTIHVTYFRVRFLRISSYFCRLHRWIIHCQMYSRLQINKQVTVTKDTTEDSVIQFTFLCVEAVKCVWFTVTVNCEWVMNWHFYWRLKIMWVMSNDPIKLTVLCGKSLMIINLT